ncbi:YqzM family protein [Salirhabdus salicampi]|nr:YqzM family protein [Salirhabdus salicampi]
MNEFEKEVQSENHDVVDSVKGFFSAFIFFMLIFFIGTIFEMFTL